MGRKIRNKEELNAMAATFEFEVMLSKNASWHTTKDIINQVGLKGFGLYCALLSAGIQSDSYIALSATQLAEELNMSKNSIQEILNNLKNCGLINLVVSGSGKQKSVYQALIPRTLIITPSFSDSSEAPKDTADEFMLAKAEPKKVEKQKKAKVIKEKVEAPKPKKSFPITTAPVQDYVELKDVDANKDDEIEDLDDFMKGIM